MQCFALELIISDKSCSLRCILLSCCRIIQIHTQTKQKKMPSEGKKNKIKQKLIVSDCMQQWHSSSGKAAGHNHQRALVLLPDHNNSSKVEEAR